MHWLGKKWNDLQQELTDHKKDFTYEITYPVGKVVSCGDLRVARVSEEDGKLKFILLHDRFNK